MELGDTPLPTSLNDYQPVGKICGRDTDGAACITDDKWKAAHGDIDHTPTPLVGNRDALTTEDEWPMVLVFKDLWRIDAPLDGEIRCRIAT